MNKIKIFAISLSFVFLGIFVSCERYPLDRLIGANGPVDSPADVLVIYDDSIAVSLGSGQGSRDIEPWGGSGIIAPFIMNCYEDKYSGSSSMKIGWSDNDGNDYAGFGFYTTKNSTGTVNISSSGYKCLEFYVKKSVEGLSTECVLRVNIPVSTNRLETDYLEISQADISDGEWHRFRIPITSFTTDKWHNLTSYVGIALARKEGASGSGGGEVYIDQIRFIKNL